MVDNSKILHRRPADRIPPGLNGFKKLHLHYLLVCRHDDFGFWFHCAQGFRVREALRFFSVDADDFFDVAGKFFDVALQFIFVRVAGIGVE